MFASRGFRLTALLSTLVVALSLVTVDTAEARRGGSFGSRGINTMRVIPATPASPKVTTPLQRTMTDGTTTRGTSGVNTPNVRPSLFGGFGGALLGGFLFSGLFGMMFGYGFGGFGGGLALLVQIAIVALIARWFFRRRQRPAMAGAGSNYSYEAPKQQAYGGGTASADRSNASRRAGGRDQVGVTDRDLAAFDARLGELQSAYSREDYDGLRRVATPEVVGYLAEELGQNATKGLRNEVYDVSLLEGDVAEAWREGGTDYATVAMRYESRDSTRDRATGAIVSGEDRVTETTEVWTFRRDTGGPWLVSAIQEA